MKGVLSLERLLSALDENGSNRVESWMLGQIIEDLELKYSGEMQKRLFDRLI